ncbi:hypothetical protein TRAPUB_8783 [Trametes pubescens]|uniref:Integrase catalytic domain-containing protein n=1 Tax=Trametes pubescens TaxID=154538 RepID=A0A1M2W480_TRAPU|nr:hypothetical protein TRAPUB_8783 [Trametes pubescens]
MTDGGKHFDNHNVRDFCAQWNTKTHVVAAYSPWVNGLVEGTNKLLLHVLKRLCAPDIGKDDWDAEVTQKDWDSLPRNWSDHLDTAVKCLNYRILPTLKFSPKELLLGCVVNTPSTPVEIAQQPMAEAEAGQHVAYVAQQHLDGYDEAVQHAMRRKKTFNKKVLVSRPGEQVFEPDTLVQVYRNDLDYTFKNERKLVPKWSTPYRVADITQDDFVNSSRGPELNWRDERANTSSNNRHQMRHLVHREEQQTCAVHPGALNIFELRDSEDLKEPIGVGDDLSLSIKKLSNGLVLALSVKIMQIRVMEENAVEFIVYRKSSVTGETQSHYVLLQVQRRHARLGRWPVWSFLRSMPWRATTIPQPGIWVSQLRSQIRPLLSIRRFFEPKSPNVREIRALLAQHPQELTIEVLTEDGDIYEVALDGSDADIAV